MKLRHLWIIILLNLFLVGCGLSNTDINNQSKVSNEGPTEETQLEVNQHKLTQTQYIIDPDTSLIIPKYDDISHRVVLLTFDDAPDGHALEIAKTLKEKNAPAMFLVNGHFLETTEQQQTLKDIYNMGFMIGNHTYHHPYLNELTEQQQKEEIISLNDLIESIIGERPTFFRPPFGVYNEITSDISREEGMHLMMWSFGYDWQEAYQSADQLVHITLTTPYLGNGSNILMHDRPWTAEAIGDIVDGLREIGLEPVDPYLIEPLQNGGSK